MLNTLWFIGVLSFYALGPTQGTVDLRQSDLCHRNSTMPCIPQNVDPYDYILVAINDCGLIGRTGVMTVGGVRQSKPVMVFDCYGGDAEWSWMSASNSDTPHLVAAEVDYYTYRANPDWFYNGTIALVEFGNDHESP